MNGSKSDGTSTHATGSGKSGNSDEMVMGLLSKMSEAYMNSKKENGELIAKVSDLENYNEELEKKANKQQKKIDKLKRKLQKLKHQGKNSEFEGSDNETGKRDVNLSGGRPRAFEKNSGSKRTLGSSNSNDRIPDILLGDVMKIKGEGSVSPSTSRSSSITRNSATAAATARVVQSIDSFKAPKRTSSNKDQSPFEEKREISIRGASPLRQPPERLTKRDAEIVRSVRNRMMEKEIEERGRVNEDQNHEIRREKESKRTKEIETQRFTDWETGTDRNRENSHVQGEQNEGDQHLKEKRGEGERDQDRDEKYKGGSAKELGRESDRYSERYVNRREREGEVKRDRSKSREPERRRDSSRSREWGNVRRRSNSRSRERSRSKDRGGRIKSKSRERSKTPEAKGRRRERSRSYSSERYDKRHEDRREGRSRFGYDNRRDARQREADRLERREREKERERERDLEQERTRERNKEKETEDKEKQRSRLIKEKNDKINIDEWTTNPSDIKHPTLTSIKEKLRQKEEEEEADNKRRKEQQMEEDKKQKWSNISTASEEHKFDHPKPQEISRPQVAIQWGQRDKVTPDPQLSAVNSSNMKKTMPLVGKMPWLQRGRKSEERQTGNPNPCPPMDNFANTAIVPGKKASRFGPPSDVVASIPPPMVLSSVPPPSSIQISATSVAPVPPPTATQTQNTLQFLDSDASTGSVQTPIGPVSGISSNSLTSFELSRNSSLSQNTAPSHVDINSMLEAAKQHINRVKESKQVSKVSLIIIITICYLY